MRSRVSGSALPRELPRALTRRSRSIIDSFWKACNCSSLTQ